VSPGRAAADNRITLRAGRDPSGALVVDVEDTGRGIPGDVIDRIFDPFFTTKSTGGVGLGLTLCHGIVSALGGRISVSSRPGEGSRFRVLLPAADAGARPARAGRARLLVVDDEPHLLRTLKLLLSHEHDVTEATCAEEALALIAAQPFDLVLCDLYLEDRSGMEVHQAVGELRPDQAARMVFMTGGAYTSDARSFLARIPNRWIEKPFSPEALRAIIDLVLAESPAA
jgi:CheY-like chemotaxis protein